ncbi:tail fiber protein [Sphingopyxis terrae]|uniref:tail fiber protein n=1 Tax=Sphingopyxis terrae TaxID=33052 RepID=UPI000B2ADD9C|nr:tail fiber protein [Sphingopyxis terrae]
MPSQHNPPLQDIAQAISGSLSRDGQGGMRTNLNMGGFRVTNLAPGTQPTDAATVSQLSASTGAPIGAVMDYAGSSAPTGWLICAGQALSRTTYAALFAVIGTTYGAPDASTFNLPDLRGRVVAGRDVDQGGYAGRLSTPNSQTLGASGGAQDMTLTEAQMPAHTHNLSGSTNSAGAHTHTYQRANGISGASGAGESLSSSTTSTTSSAGDHAHTLSGTAASTGGGQAHPNVQPTIILTKIIKASNS